MRFCLILACTLLAPVANAQRDSFAPAASMSSPRAQHTATLLADGRVLIAGGLSKGFGSPLATAELYDPRTGTFAPTGRMTTPRFFHTATLLPDGKVLIAGGRSDPVKAGEVGTAELYDPSTGVFTSTGSMAKIRGIHTATLLADGRVLMTAFSFAFNLVAPPSYAEIYDAQSASFSDAGQIAMGGGTATLLADGQVLVTEGCGNFRDAAQLFDPHTGVVAFTGPMTGGNCAINTATLLPSGKVLIVGEDEYDSVPADAQIYDPDTQAFEQAGPTGTTNHPHEYGAAAAMPDGTVLLVGGQLPGGRGDPGAELFVPDAGAFVSIAPMNHARHNHTATLLPDGSVLVAGGYEFWADATDSAEIYQPVLRISPPALYAVSDYAGAQGAIQHAGTSRLASAGDPAGAGEPLAIYLTGLPEGSVVPPQVSIGGRLAEILWFGKTPGYETLNQINARVPEGVAPGPAVPVRLIFLGRSSNEVTIGIR